MTFTASANDSILSLARGIGIDNYNILANKADIAIPDFGLADRNTNTPQVLIANVSEDLRTQDGSYDGRFGVRIEYNPDIAYQVERTHSFGSYTATVQDHAARHAAVLRNNRDNNLNIVINQFTGQSSFDTAGEGSATLTNDTVFIRGTQQDVTAISAIILDEMNRNHDFDKHAFQDHLVESLDWGVFSPANFARALRSPAGSMR